MTTQASENMGSRGGLGVKITGGLPTQRYFTPAGEEIFAVPSMREFQQKDENGKIVRSGTRDGNLDKGWTMTMPEVLKFKCPCKQFHDTQEAVDVCVSKRAIESAKWETRAQKEINATSSASETRIDDLEKDVKGMSEGIEAIKKALGIE
jgi:hypothetical protein